MQPFGFMNATLLVKVFFDFFCGQFRAISDQLYRTPEHHKFVRQQVVDQVSL